MTTLYLPANVALWLLLESGADNNDPDAIYLQSLGSEIVRLDDPSPEPSPAKTPDPSAQ